MPDNMTAKDVAGALQTRWPAAEFLTIREAPMHSDRSGRKLDLLVVSLWKSRGLALDGVEIKVSMSDFRRELADGAKAEWWWQHVHRFWLACPSDLAKKVKASGELPESWGLLACYPDSAPRTLVPPTKHTPKPIEWVTTVGLMRAAADAGVNALHWAEQRGYSRGIEEAPKVAERSTGFELDRALRRAEAAESKIAQFKAETGIDIGTYYTHDLKRIGQAVNLLLAEGRSLAQIAALARSTAKQSEQLADALDQAEAACR